MDADASSGMVGNTTTELKVRRVGKSRRGRPAKLPPDEFQQEDGPYEQRNDNTDKHLKSPSPLVVQDNTVLPTANQHESLLVTNANGASSPATAATQHDDISNNSNSSMDKNSVHSVQGDVVDENSTSLRTTTSSDAVRTSPPFEDIVGIVSGNDIQTPQPTNAGRRKRKPEVPRKTFQRSSESGASASSSSSSSSLTIDHQQQRQSASDAFASLSMAPDMSVASIPKLSTVCVKMNDGGEGEDGNDDENGGNGEDGSAEEENSHTPLVPRQPGGWRRLVGKSTKRRKNYSPEALEKAIDAVCTGKLGTRRAAIVYGIPRSTLRNKLNKILPHLHHQQRNVVAPAAGKSAGAESLLSPSGAAAGTDRLQQQANQPVKSPSHLSSRRNSMEFAANSSGLAAEAASLLPSQAGNTRKRIRRRAGSSAAAAAARTQKSAASEPVKEQAFVESSTNNNTAAAGFDNSQLLWPQHSQHNMLGMFRPAAPGNTALQFSGNMDTAFASGANPFLGEVTLGSRSNELSRMLFESLSGNGGGGGRGGIQQPNFSATSQALYQHHVDASKLSITPATGTTTSLPFMQPNFLLPHHSDSNEQHNLYQNNQNHQNRSLFDSIRQSLRPTAHNSSAIAQPVATGGMSAHNIHNGSGGADWPASTWFSQCLKPQPFVESCGTSAANNLVSPQTPVGQQNPPLFASQPQTTTPVSGGGFPSVFNSSHTEQQFAQADGFSNNRSSSTFPSASAFMSSSNTVNSSTNPSVPVEWSHPITAATFWQQMMMMTTPTGANMATTATYQQPIPNHNSLNFPTINHSASAPVATDPHGMSAVGQAMLTLARFLASRNVNATTTVNPTTNYLATHAMPLLLGAAMAQLQQVAATGAANSTSPSNPMALAMMLASSVLHQQHSHVVQHPAQHSFHTLSETAISSSKPAVVIPRVWSVTGDANQATKQESWSLTDGAASVNSDSMPRVVKKRSRPTSNTIRQPVKKRTRRRQQQLSPSNSSLPSSAASPHTPSTTPNNNDTASNSTSMLFSQTPAIPSALSKSNSLSRSSSVGAANAQSGTDTFDQNAPVRKIRTESEDRCRRSYSLSPSSETDAQHSIGALQTDQS